MNKYRYQNKNFKSQITKARGYKRSAKKIPTTNQEIFFAKIGLDNWPTKLALVFSVAALIYLTYIPNFVYIKDIKVSGLKIEGREKITNQIKSYLTRKSFWPRKNLVLLNTGNLKNFLEKENFDVQKVEIIDKNYPNTLEVILSPRYPKFYTFDGFKTFVISNDGIIIEEAENINSTSSLTKINFEVQKDWVTGQTAISSENLNLINKALRNLPTNFGIKIAAFHLTEEKNQDLNIDTQNGYLLKLDLRTSFEDSYRYLQALFSRLNSSNISQLAYIDLRVPERAYICFKNTACSRPSEIVAGSSTSTEESLKIIE